MKIKFELGYYKLPCSYDGCKKNPIVMYNSSNGIEIYLCKEHFKEIAKALETENIETNASKLNDYLAKQEQQKNRPKGSSLKQTTFNDYPSH